MPIRRSCRTGVRNSKPSRTYFFLCRWIVVKSSKQQTFTMDQNQSLTLNPSEVLTLNQIKRDAQGKLEEELSHAKTELEEMKQVFIQLQINKYMHGWGPHRGAKVIWGMPVRKRFFLSMSSPKQIHSCIHWMFWNKSAILLFYCKCFMPVVQARSHLQVDSGYMVTIQIKISGHIFSYIIIQFKIWKLHFSTNYNSWYGPNLILSQFQNHLFLCILKLSGHMVS